MVSIIMKKFVCIFVLFVASLSAAQETIKIFSPYNASHSGTPAMLRVIDQANQQQSTYQFILEFRPGGNQLTALQAMNNRTLSIIAPAFAEHVSSGAVRQEDFVPVITLGEACWAVIVNQPFAEMREIMVGSVAPGNAAHLTALTIGERFQRPVVYVGFKSNNDAVVNIAGNHGVNMAIDRYETYESVKSSNPRMHVFAASCASRLPKAPDIPTLKEMNIDVPLVFNIVVAPRSMDPALRSAVTGILQTALQRVGSQEIFQLSGMIVPNERPEQYYTRSIAQIRRVQDRFRDQIQKAK